MEISLCISKHRHHSPLISDTACNKCLRWMVILKPGLAPLSSDSNVPWEWRSTETGRLTVKLSPGASCYLKAPLQPPFTFFCLVAGCCKSWKYHTFLRLLTVTFYPDIQTELLCPWRVLRKGKHTNGRSIKHTIFFFNASFSIHVPNGHIMRYNCPRCGKSL